MQVKEHMIRREDASFGFLCLPTLLRPETRGKISLRSSDPYDPPLIEMKYLDKQEDVELMIRGNLELEDRGIKLSLSRLGFSINISLFI